MHRIAVFRVALFIDSIVFVLKLSVPVFLIVSGAEELRLFNEQEWRDSSYMTEMFIAFYFVGGSFVLILTLVRFFTNWSQYRLERDGEYSAQTCASHFWSNFSWFFVSIGHIAIDGALIGLDWTEGKWLRIVVISFLCWECLMACFMITIKLLFRNVSNASQMEVASPQRTYSVKA